MPDGAVHSMIGLFANETCLSFLYIYIFKSGSESEEANFVLVAVLLVLMHL